MSYAQLLGHDLLSPSDERQLIREAQSGNENSRERLILSNIGLCNKIALAYARPNQDVSAECLMGDAVIGLMKAIDKFSLEMGVRFSTYTVPAIRTFVERSPMLNGMLRVPEWMRETQRKIRKAERILAESGNNAPSSEEIAAVSGVPLEHVEQHMLLEARTTLSLDAPIGEDDDGSMTLADIIPIEDTGIRLMEIGYELAWFLGLLPKIERFILTRSYGIPRKWSNEELATLFGRSIAWVTRTRKRTLEALQRLGEALKGNPSQISLAHDCPRWVMNLRPVSVPEGVSFIDGEPVRKAELHPQPEPQQLYFGL